MVGIELSVRRPPDPHSTELPVHLEAQDRRAEVCRTYKYHGEDIVVTFGVIE